MATTPTVDLPEVTSRPSGPSAGCAVCSAAAGRSGLCYCCRLLVTQLRLPLAPVATVADFTVGDRLHRWLRGYKDAPVAEARCQGADRLARLLSDHIAAHGPDLERRFGGPWDVVVTVPSSARPGPAPFDGVVDRVAPLGCRRRAWLVRGPESTGHLLAARRGFVPTPEAAPVLVRDRRVLVVDDTYVTGARAQSAAAALRMAGARVGGVLAVGRRRSGGPGRHR